MEIRVLTSSSVHSRGLDDFIASQMICGKCSNGLQFGRTGGQSCEPLEEEIGGEVTSARQTESLSDRFLHPFHGGLLSITDSTVHDNTVTAGLGGPGGLPDGDDGSDGQALGPDVYL